MRRNIVLLLLCLLCLSGCGQKAAELDMAAFRQELLEAAALSAPMDISAEGMTSLYGIDMADVQDSIGCSALSGTFADEIIVLQAVDGDAAGRLAAALETYRQSLLTQARDYDPERFALMDDCPVLQKNNCVALFLCENHAALEELFEKAV